MLKHAGTIRLETDRLILRRFEQEDYIDMFENWASDPEVTRYLTWPTHDNPEISREVTRLWIKEYFSLENYQWAIELMENKRVVGSLGFVNLDNNNENCEIGYCIGKEYWNKGIITEAFTAVIKFAFEEIGFERITGRHDVDNPASGRVMEKCNLKYEGILRKIIKNHKGILVDCKYYSILKEEYFEAINGK